MRIEIGMAVLALALLAGTASAQSQVTVEVKTAKLMEKPGYLGKSVGVANRGERLTVRSTQGAWYQVTTARGTLGWINQRSVVVPGKGQVSSAGESGTGTSESEIALAGRGFSKDVEDQYRQKNPNLDYSHIDAIEAAGEPDLSAVMMFALAGSLRGVK